MYEQHATCGGADVGLFPVGSGHLVAHHLYRFAEAELVRNWSDGVREDLLEKAATKEEVRLEGDSSLILLFQGVSTHTFPFPLFVSICRIIISSSHKPISP